MGVWDVISHPVIWVFALGLAVFRYVTRDRRVRRWFTKEDIKLLKSKLPQEGSQAPTDWGTTVGANVKMSRSSVKELGKLDAIVIGSGMSGLTTACLLSQLGFRVVVLESSSSAGGSLATFERKGFEFDSGVGHVAGMGKWEFGRRVMDRVTGGAVEWKEMERKCDEVKVEGEGGGTFHFTNDAKHNKRILKERFQDKKDQECIDYYFRSVALARVLLLPWYLIKLIPSRSLRSFFFRTFLAPLNKFVSRTTGDHLRQYTSNTDLVGVLTYQYPSIGVTPNHSSWLSQLSVSNLAAKSAPSYPVGGPAAITLAACELIRLNGGLVFTESKVERLLFDDNTDRGFSLLERSEVCWGVVVNGHKLYAKHVICAAGARQGILNLLPERHRPRLGDFPNALKYFDGVAPSSWSSSTTIITANKDGEYDSVEAPAAVPIAKHVPRAPSGVGPSTSFLRLHVGLLGSGETLKLPRGNVWLFPSWDHDADSRRAFVSRDAAPPAVLISCPSVKDPSYEQRWPGRSAVVMSVPCDFKWFAEWRSLPRKERGQAYGKLKDWWTDRLLKVLFTHYPQLKSCLVTTSLCTPLSTNTFFSVERGESLGVQASVGRITTHAPDLAPETDIRGLYFAGQDLAAVGGVEGGLMAGLLCTLTICRSAMLEYAVIWMTSRWW